MTLAGSRGYSKFAMDTTWMKCLQKYFLLVILHLGWAVLRINAADACEKLSVSGTMWQGNREGTYNRVSDIQCDDGGSHVYKQSGGPNYLYYIQANQGWRGWMVGTTICLNSGGIAIQDDAMYPEQVTGPWEEVYAGNWYYSYNMVVKCYSLNTASIAGIVVGCVLVLAIIAVIIACCCCHKKKNTGTVRTHRTSTDTVFSTDTSQAVQYSGAHTQLHPHQSPATFSGPPTYEAHMSQGYGPPPAYSSQNTEGVNRAFVGDSTSGERPESVPPSYVAQVPHGQEDPFKDQAKVEG